MNKVLLFNPRAAEHKPRIPNSVLQVAASIEGKYEWSIVDGNIEEAPVAKLFHYLRTGEYAYFGCTVMPGPQLRQAIIASSEIRKNFPSVKIAWGGYFPSNQPEVCLRSGYVDAIINGPGDKSFPALLDAWEKNETVPGEIPNLIFLREGRMITTQKDAIYEQDTLPDLPYEKLDAIYPLKRYLGKTYLGTRTIAYHSSFGCPFTCSFCAVVPVYNARWKGKSAGKIYNDIKFLKVKFGGNAIEFHDNNFFVSEKRTVEFARLVHGEKMTWWGEGRIDTIDKYKDESLEIMREAGCRMIFFGAETGNDERLRAMDKGGTQTGEQILRFAERMKKFDIVPEYSFVLGTPAESEEEALRQVEEDIAFIRQVKEVNPQTEIIIYVYSPVPVEGSALYEKVKSNGFRFPEKLEDWISPQWEKFDLRKNPLTPWLTPKIVDRIRNFETVINARYPTISDTRLSSFRRNVMKISGTWRYSAKFYSLPLELKLLQKLWKYRQPEKEGF